MKQYKYICICHTFHCLFSIYHFVTTSHNTHTVIYIKQNMLTFRNFVYRALLYDYKQLNTGNACFGSFVGMCLRSL